MAARISLSANAIQTGDRLSRGVQPGQMAGVGVGLTQAHQAHIGVQLDDRAQRMGLMYADPW